MTSCAITRPRLAPSAWRMTISDSRIAVRANISVATFADAAPSTDRMMVEAVDRFSLDPTFCVAAACFRVSTAALRNIGSTPKPNTGRPLRVKWKRGLRREAFANYSIQTIFNFMTPSCANGQPT